MEGGLDRLMHMLLWQLKGLSTAALPSARGDGCGGMKSIGLTHSLLDKEEEEEKWEEGARSRRKEGSMSSCNSTLQHTTWSEEAPRLLTARTLETTK